MQITLRRLPFVPAPSAFHNYLRFADVAPRTVFLENSPSCVTPNYARGMNYRTARRLLEIPHKCTITGNRGKSLPSKNVYIKYSAVPPHFRLNCRRYAKYMQIPPGPFK